MKLQLRRRNARSLHTIHVGAETRIGSDNDNDIVLVDPMVAPHHGVLQTVGDHVSVEDLGSQTGTWVDGYRIRRRARLYRSLVIGAYEFRPVQCDDQVLLIERLDTGERSEFDGPTPATLPWSGTFEGAPCRIFRPEDGSERERHLIVSIEPPEARIIEPVSSREHQITATQRVSLLYFLARAAEADRERGEGEGWRTTEEVAVAIWGRQGRVDASKRLSTITFRVRSELERAGFDKDLIERSPAGLRLVASSVEVY